MLSSYSESQPLAGHPRGLPPAGTLGAKRPVFRPVTYARQLAGLAFFYFLGWFSNFLGFVAWSIGYRKGQTEFWQQTIGRLFRIWQRAGVVLGVIEIRVKGAERLASLRGTIVAANHPSLVDAFALLCHVPRAVCVMRSDLAANAAISRLAALAGYIANDRGPALVRGGIARLSAGDNVLIFPEGTRSHGAMLAPFKRGFALMATKSRAPVQTVLIRLEGEYFSKGHGLFQPAVLPVRLTIEPGEVFTPGSEENADEFAGRIEAYFRRVNPHSQPGGQGI